MNGVLWFADGRMASFDCGFVHPLRQTFEITCENGVVTIPEMWVPPQRADYATRAGDASQTHAVEGEDQMQHMLENLSRAAIQNQPVHPDPEEAVKTLRVLDALARSAREGRAIEIV
jgi:predicted dehydrogenase